MKQTVRRVLLGTLLVLCLGLLVTPTRATSSLMITLDPSTIAPGSTTLVTVTSTLPAGGVLLMSIPAPLMTTIQPSGCTAQTDGWQCALTESPQTVVLQVQAPTNTPDGTPFTLTAQAAGTTTTTTLTVLGGPSGTWTPTPTQTATATAAPTATPWVVTATPSATATATPTPTTGPQPDAYEPNNTLAQAAPIGLGSSDKLSFWPAPDVDYFALTIKDSQAGLQLTIETTISPGLDTRVRLLRPDGSVVAENDDVSPTDVRSRIETTAEAGRLIIEVTNASPARPDFKLYRLEVQLAEATTATATPAPTTDRVWDAYAGNYAWDTAADIPLGAPMKDLSFGCPNYEYLSPTLGTCTVPDFFRITVKGGTCYEATTTVTPGVDTNVIVYGVGRDTEPPWAGNDDAAPDDLGSRVRFCVPPERGVSDAYLLIGPVGRLPAPLAERRYTLTVQAEVPATPTLTPLPSPSPNADMGQTPAQGSGPAAPNAPNPGMGGQGAAGGMAPNTSPQVIPPPAQADTTTDGFTPVRNVTIESVTNAAPEPTAVPLVITPMSVLACYDRNANQQCDVDEGIAGMAVVVSDARRGVVLGTSLTDGQGAATITVRVPETTELLVAVPSFGYAQRATVRQAQVPPLLIKKTVPLPALIP